MFLEALCFCACRHTDSIFMWVSFCQNVISCAFGINQIKLRKQSAGWFIGMAGATTLQAGLTLEFSLLTRAHLLYSECICVETQGEDSMSEVAEKCIRPWGGKYACIALLIKTDVAGTSGLKSPLAWRKAFSVCFALLTLFSVHLPLTPYFLSVERNPFRCLKHIKLFTSLWENSINLFLTSQENHAQHISSDWAEKLLMKEEIG